MRHATVKNAPNLDLRQIAPAVGPAPSRSRPASHGSKCSLDERSDIRDAASKLHCPSRIALRSIRATKKKETNEKKKGSGTPQDAYADDRAT
jgi:hypothetical protein